MLEGKGLGYPYWSTQSEWIGSDVIYVSDDRDFADVARWFDSFDIVSDARLVGAGQDYHVAVGRRLRTAPKPSAADLAGMHRERGSAID